MKLSISITVLATLLLGLFFWRSPGASASAPTLEPQTNVTIDEPLAHVTRKAQAADVVASHAEKGAFGGVPSDVDANLPKVLPTSLPPSFYDGAETPAKQQWRRDKAQLRLTILDSVRTCLGGDDVGEGTVDVEIHFENKNGMSSATDVGAFPHDNPNANELESAGKERVLGCVRDAMAGRDFEMHYAMEMAPESVHRIAIKLPTRNDPVYDYLKGGTWNE